MLNIGEKDILTEIMKLEEEFFRESKDKLGSALEMMRFLSAFYDMFSEGFREQELPAEDKYVVPLTLAMSCQYHLIMSTLSAMRGHSTDSHQHSRRSIEACAFSYKIYQHPHLAEIWLMAGKSKEHYEKYREKFTKLFPQDHLLLNELGTRYDMCSKLIHHTIYSIASKIKVENFDDQLKNLNFNYFDNVSNREPYLSLFHIWDTHQLIIKIYMSIFEDITRKNKGIWDLRINSLEAQVKYYKELWKDKLLKGYAEE